MIKDKLNYAKTYFGISENLKKGFEWLQSQNLTAIEPGKYMIDGEHIYANVQEYETKKDAKYEAHRKYIDIQYVAEGSELVGICDIKNCTTYTQYDIEKDIEFFDCNTNNEYYTLNQGEFLVLFPNDAHKPSINPIKSDLGKNIVKKIVVKVEVD